MKYLLPALFVVDMSGLSVLQMAGALNIASNPLLENLRSLEKLTALTLPGITGNYITQGLSLFPGFALSGLPSILGGINIQSNAKLSSLTGLQNLRVVLMAYIVNNRTLKDLCPIKTSITALSTLPAFNYTSYEVAAGVTHKRSVGALTLQYNSSYATIQDALTAVALCK